MFYNWKFKKFIDTISLTSWQAQYIVYCKKSREPNQNKVISHHILLNKGRNTNVESVMSPIRRTIALILFRPLPSTLILVNHFPISILMGMI